MAVTPIGDTLLSQQVSHYTYVWLTIRMYQDATELRCLEDWHQIHPPVPKALAARQMSLMCPLD